MTALTKDDLQKRERTLNTIVNQCLQIAFDHISKDYAASEHRNLYLSVCINMLGQLIDSIALNEEGVNDLSLQVIRHVINFCDLLKERKREEMKKEAH